VGNKGSTLRKSIWFAFRERYFLNFSAAVAVRLLALFFGAAAARSDTLADYAVNTLAADLQSSDTNPNSVASDIGFLSGINPFSQAGFFPNYGNPAPSLGVKTLSNNLGDARTNNQGVTFTLTPNPGYSLNLSSVTFDIAASEVPGATIDQVSQIFIYTDRDNQAVPVAAWFATDTTADNTPSAFGSSPVTDLSANPLYQNVTVPITFSVYTFGSNSNSWAMFDNIKVDGVTIAVVPEPSTYAMLVFGAGLLAGALRLRRGR
jgi:hypothetical protein